MSVAALAKDPVVLSYLMGLVGARTRASVRVRDPTVGSEKPHRTLNQGLLLHGMRD